MAGGLCSAVENTINTVYYELLQIQRRLAGESGSSWAGLILYGDILLAFEKARGNHRALDPEGHEEKKGLYWGRGRKGCGLVTLSAREQSTRDGF